MRFLLLALISFLFNMPPAKANDVCYSTKEIHLGDRFSHCAKGDIIKVIVMLADSFSTYDDMGKGLVHIDGVTSYCSFEHEIVEIGSAVSMIKGRKNDPVRVFSCVYVGEDRGGKFR